jgi:GNAT superfamily N-acetyltransferase
MLRPAVDADLDSCGLVWRDATADYQVRLNQPAPTVDLSRIRRLHAHALATDPDRFVVDERVGPDGAREIVAFGSAVRRGSVSFLSMLFVRPDQQGRGIGRAILERVLPRDGSILATATDSAQPVSNALYAGLGIVPRVPLWGVVGRPGAAWAPPPLPDGYVTGELAAVDAAEVDELDLEVLGFAHRADHAYLEREGAIGIAHRGAGGRLAGYAYARPSGQLGPVAVRDPAALGAVAGHALEACEPRGASFAWVPGTADGAWRVLLGAGLRLDGFPILLCWTEPFADLGRYLPISPGLL